VQLGKNNSRSGTWRPRDVAAGVDCKTTLVLPLDDASSALLSTPILSLLLTHSLCLPYKKNPQQQQQQNPKPNTEEEEHHCSRLAINQQPWLSFS
jgi:hypothetical protein